MTVPPMPSDWCFPLAPAVLSADYWGDRGAAGHVCPGGDNRPVEPLVVGGVARMRPGPDADHESRSAVHRRGVDGVCPGGVGPSGDPLWPAGGAADIGRPGHDAAHRQGGALGPAVLAEPDD